LLAERRTRGPWGLRGGSDGAPGHDEVVDVRGRRRRIASKSSLTLAAGERIVVATPGGGGWGKAKRGKERATPGLKRTGATSSRK
jgi:N-methylhydantoinase B/oxoprolinase/acetone carboxylase alpha subunit